jgi:uncharacterized membrane protein YqjE
MTTPDGGQPAGLLGSLSALLARALSLLLTRGELAALELTEARERVVRWLVLSLIGAVLLLAALVTFSVWVAAVFWDGPRGLALGLLALGYAVAGVVAVSIVRREAATAPALFAQTRAELQKDCDALAGSRQGTDDAR